MLYKMSKEIIGADSYNNSCFKSDESTLIYSIWIITALKALDKSCWAFWIILSDQNVLLLIMLITDDQTNFEDVKFA